ncbi:transketolase, thiamine diphosphate binding domain protein, partial [Vibrio parahaemolyticus Peru-288]
TQCVWLL